MKNRYKRQKSGIAVRIGVICIRAMMMLLVGTVVYAIYSQAAWVTPQ